MTWKTVSFVAMLFMLFLAVPHPAQAAPALTGPSWQVVEIAGKPVTDCQPKREPHMVFNAAGRVSGSTGCNRFNGTYQLDGTSLNFSGLVMTKMACPPPLDALERAFIQALAAVTSVRESGNSLELLDAGGRVQMRLQSR